MGGVVFEVYGAVITFWGSAALSMVAFVIYLCVQIGLHYKHAKQLKDSDKKEEEEKGKLITEFISNQGFHRNPIRDFKRKHGFCFQHFKIRKKYEYLYLSFIQSNLI